jgi:hypothetical protein
MIMDTTLFRNPETPLTEEQKLLRKLVAEKVTADPVHFDMRTWSTTMELTCNTTACLAGWSVFLSGLSVHQAVALYGDMESTAIARLGLTLAEYMQEPLGTPLFFATEDEARERIQALAEAA